MRSVLRQLLALLALVASIVAASTAVAHAETSAGGIGIQLLEPSFDPDFEQWETEIGGPVEPGDTITGWIRISNGGTTAQTVEVYPGAASMRNGHFTVEDPGSSNRLTSWTTVDERTVALAAGRYADVKVTVRIPADAPTGDRYAVIWAQPATGDGGGVSTAPRVGVRLHPTVKPPNGHTADFVINGLTAERDSDGQAVVVADVRNTGTWAVEIEGALTLSGGSIVGPVDADATVVAAGVGGKVRFRIPDSADLPAGPWQANVALHSASLERKYAGDVTFPNVASSGSLGSLGSSAMPWSSLAGGSAR